MIEYFKNIFGGASAICKGMWVTLKTMFKPAITVQYPTEKLVPFEKFRGVLMFDPEVCISCNLCVKACPSFCIHLENAVWSHVGVPVSLGPYVPQHIRSRLPSIDECIGVFHS